MSFYEVAGDGPSKRFVDKNDVDYTDEVITITRLITPKQREMIQGFAMQSRAPLEVIKAAAKYANKDCSETDWKSVRTSSFRDDYRTALPAGFVIDDMGNILKFFKELDNQGSLKIIDIRSLEYSIMAFNDSPNNWQSLKKSVAAFNRRHDDLFHIELEYNRVRFGVIISTFHTNIGKITYSSERQKSLKEFWFPKIDQYFHKPSDRQQDKAAVVLDFVEQCRANVKSREAQNEL